MTDPPIPEEFIRRIHAAPGQMVLAVTGGGSKAISDLLAVPGGSRTVLEAIVPYSAASLMEFLHARPESFCSARTARMMAMAAFQRAKHLQQSTRSILAQQPPVPPGDGSSLNHPIGVGCTASLASDRTKRGPHRIHVALQTVGATTTHSLELVKGRRSRLDEEVIAAQVVLNAVAEAFGMAEQLPLPLMEDEKVEFTRTIAPPEWQDLLLGRTKLVRHAPTAGGSPSPETDQKALEAAHRPRAIFSGAFNPLHAGHLQMAEIAASRLGLPVEFELSIENVDKPPLDYTEIAERTAQFNQQHMPLWLTRAPTFEEKSALFPGATFIVGADTMLRIGQPRYYGNSAAAAEAAFQRIAQRGCRFLVFGRLVDHQFQSCGDLPLPDALRKLCDEVPGELYRHDVSSTELRRQPEQD